jgi:hypothetical protein
VEKLGRQIHSLVITLHPPPFKRSISLLDAIKDTLRFASVPALRPKTQANFAELAA